MRLFKSGKELLKFSLDRNRPTSAVLVCASLFPRFGWQVRFRMKGHLFTVCRAEPDHRHFAQGWTGRLKMNVKNIGAKIGSLIALGLLLIRD